MSGFDRDAFVLVLALPLFAAAASCASQDHPPEPPDVSDLLAAYADPGGKVDASQRVSWLDAAQSQLKRLGGGKGNVLIINLFETALARLDKVSLPDSHDGILPTRVDGTVEVDVRCGQTDDQTAHVRVRVVDGKIAPLFWGTAHACPFVNTEGQLVSYDGGFAMYHYPAGDLLVRIDGAATTSGEPLKLDFRVLDKQIETRVVTGAGDVIATRDGAALLVRAANGKFRCDPTAAECQ